MQFSTQLYFMHSEPGQFLILNEHDNDSYIILDSFNFHIPKTANIFVKVCFSNLNSFVFLITQ